jgi:hypothetical protein
MQESNILTLIHMPHRTAPDDKNRRKMFVDQVSVAAGRKISSAQGLLNAAIGAKRPVRMGAPLNHDVDNFPYPAVPQR